MKDTRPYLSLQWGTSLLASQSAACSSPSPCSLNDHWLILLGRTLHVAYGLETRFLSGLWWAWPSPCPPPLPCSCSQHLPSCFLTPDLGPCCFLCSHFTHHSVTDSLCDGPALMSPNSPSWSGLSMTHMWPLGACCRHIYFMSTPAWSSGSGGRP